MVQELERLRKEYEALISRKTRNAIKITGFTFDISILY